MIKSDKNIGSNENSENPFSDMEPDKANYMMKELEKSGRHGRRKT